MNWLRASLLAQAALALYFLQAIQWLPLGRWNYQPEHGGLSPFSNLPLLRLAQQGYLSAWEVIVVVAFAMPFAAFLFAYSRGLRLLMWMQVAFYSVWLGIEMTWWVLYAVGRSESQVQRSKESSGKQPSCYPRLVAIFHLTARTSFSTYFSC